MSTEADTSGSDTESDKLSSPYASTIRTESLFSGSNASTEDFTPNDKQRERGNAFLGYYECLNSGNPELSIPTISLSTARIDLDNPTAGVDEGKHLVLTKIKESPYLKDTSLFVITGKRRDGSGTMFNEFPSWIQGVKHLLNGNPIKGSGTYEVIIKKVVNNNENEPNVPNEEMLKKWEKEAKKDKDITYKMALAGFYMRGNKGNSGNYAKTNKCYLEAKNFYLKAAHLGSIEAKLCLGYIYSIGLTKPSDYAPKRAKKWFKKVAKKTDDDKIARISMRNIATLFHSKDIEPSFIETVKENLSLSDEEPLYIKKAKKWYKRSSEKGDSQSAYHLGLLCETKDKNEAEDWFNKAIEFDNNNLYAKAKLGRILINKNDVNEKERGIEMLKETANVGLDMGQTYLGDYYEKEKNYKDAIEFYSKAAKQKRGYYSHVAQHRLKKLKDEKHVDEYIEYIEDIEDILEYYDKEFNGGYIDPEEEFKEIR